MCGVWFYFLGWIIPVNPQNVQTCCLSSEGTTLGAHCYPGMKAVLAQFIPLCMGKFYILCLFFSWPQQRAPLRYVIFLFVCLFLTPEKGPLRYLLLCLFLKFLEGLWLNLSLLWLQSLLLIVYQKNIHCFQQPEFLNVLCAVLSCSVVSNSLRPNGL